ncbi:hypothetical protein [Streptosporangium sp. NPDC006930]
MSALTWVLWAFHTVTDCVIALYRDFTAVTGRGGADTAPFFILTNQQIS